MLERYLGFDVISSGQSTKYINKKLNNAPFLLDIIHVYLCLMACFLMLRSEMGGIEL